MAADQPKSAGGEHEKIRALGKYQITKRLGAGGMGAVFLATDTELKRAVALKVLPKERAENPTLVRRFKAEAQAVAQLRHDNIVAIYDTGEIQGFPYLALEYVDGQDLLSLIQKRGPIPPKRSLKIMRQVTDALQHAYQKSIIHRDIKPSNLLIQVDGTAKITDFGLARSVDETLDTSITRAGTTVGTVDYISPEQACDSKAADIRSDIYSLGCTWYHMLTGQPPFPDGNMQNKLHGHINSPPPNPRQINSSVPEAYVAVMHRMMAKRPQDRYETPAALLADLNQVAGVASSVTAELFDEPSGGGSVKGDYDSDEPPSTGPTKSKKSSSGPGARPQVKSDDSAPSKINEKWRGRGGAVRKPTATRGVGSGGGDLEAGDAVDDAPGTSRKSKKLPPRERKEPGGFSIDLDLARIGLIGLVTVGAIGLFWFAFSRAGSFTSSGDGQAAVGGGPADTASRQPVQQPVLNPNAPQAPIPGEGPKTTAIVDAPDPVSTATAAVELAGDPVNVDRGGAAFPGIDDITDPKSTAARELVPDWVYALRGAPAEGLPTVVVDYPPRFGGEASIDAAIQQQRGTQRVVELKGTGPFSLRPVLVQSCQRLVIRAAEGSEPVVILKGTADATRGHGHVHLIGGVLEIRGLHVIAASPGLSEPSAIFSTEGGTVALRDCSVTVPNESGPMIVARARESALHPFPSRVLIENCLIRGARATAANVRGPRSDVVIGGSLLANDLTALVSAEVLPESATANVAAEPEGATGSDAATNAATTEAAPASSAASEIPLAVRVLGSVLSSSGPLLSLEQAPSDVVRRGVVRLHRTVAASKGGTGATLLALPSWPSRRTTVSGQPRIAGLSWHQDQSWLPGWPTLVRLGDEVVESPDDWATFLGQPLETGVLDQAAVLEFPVDLEHVSGSHATAWRTRVPAAILAGHLIGVSASLPSPPTALIDKHLLLASRPRLPDGFVNLPLNDKIQKYELKGLKQKLGDLLNGAEVADGAHVQLTGIGLVNLPPIHLRNKSLRLEFVQASEGAALTIRPEAVQGEVPEAWLTVDGGRLDLVGARIQASPSKTRESPARLILARDCDLTIRNCSFEGPAVEDDQAHGLIDWVQTSPGSGRQHAFVADSLFVGSQPLLSADVDSRLLVVNNNLFAAKGDGIVLRSRAGATVVERAREGWVVLEHSTLLFGHSAMQFAGLTAGRKTPAVRVVSTACVFAPAPGTTGATLLRHPESMTRSNLFDWWENRNGYAPALKHFRLSQSTAPEAGQDFTGDWTLFWTGEHVESPHVGLNGVMMATVLTSLTNLTPPLVALNPNCSGSGGAPDGSPIGIKTDRVGPLGGGTVVGPTAPKVGTPGVGTPRPGNRPDF